MSDTERQKAWREQGYFIVRGLLSSDESAQMLQEIVDLVRTDPPADHKNELAYNHGDNYLIYPETAPAPTARNPEDFVGKIFNCHAEGTARKIAERDDIVAIIGELLDGDLDCFQSQFIFKHPGVIGQPWHQDSYYFRFDKQPQVGVWAALSEATEKNGCLWVSPGSHKAREIYDHEPDTRPGAQRGYLEITTQDTSNKIPVLMQPGDVLFFHSYLMHMSTDNCAEDARAAMVYHYGRADSKAESPELAEKLSRVNRWIPVSRKAA